MEVVIAAPDELARLAAGAIGKLLRSRPDAVLGLATGSSPLAVYDELVRRARLGRLNQRTHGGPANSTPAANAAGCHRVVVESWA